MWNTVLSAVNMGLKAASDIDLLVLADYQRGFENLGPDHALVPGTEIPKPAGVFPRYVEEDEGEKA